MPTTTNQLIALACESAHSPGKLSQALELLNLELSGLCQKQDLAAARGDYVFTFSAPFLLNAPVRPLSPPNIGSGPWRLPVDYLRLSGSSGSSGAQKSFIWYLDGVPYPIVPCDLAEFDLQVQQAGVQSYVWLEATDMAQPYGDRIVLETTADLVAGSKTIANLGSVVGLVAGSVMGVAGEGILPGSMLQTISAPSATLSDAPLQTVIGASIFFGYPPTTWLYPPPSSAVTARIRYQRRMPNIVNGARYPWFQNDEYLKEKLTGLLCALNDDARAERILAGPSVPTSADGKLTLWLAAKDDEPSHPQTVQLDRRRFGGRLSDLATTKRVGWD